MRLNVMPLAFIASSLLALAARAEDYLPECDLPLDVHQYFRFKNGDPDAHFVLSLSNNFLKSGHSAQKVFAAIANATSQWIQVDDNSEHHESACWSRVDSGSFVMPQDHGAGGWSNIDDHEAYNIVAAVSQSLIADVTVYPDQHPWRDVTPILNANMRNPGFFDNPSNVTLLTVGAIVGITMLSVIGFLSYYSCTKSNATTAASTDKSTRARLMPDDVTPSDVPPSEGAQATHQGYGATATV